MGSACFISLLNLILIQAGTRMDREEVWHDFLTGEQRVLPSSEFSVFCQSCNAFWIGSKYRDNIIKCEKKPLANQPAPLLPEH